MKKREELEEPCGDLQTDSRGGPGFKCSLARGHRGRHEARVLGELLDSWPRMGMPPKKWFGSGAKFRCKDSNPNLLVQSQTSCQLDHSGKEGT